MDNQRTNERKREMKTTPTYKQFMLDIKACKNDYQKLQVVKEYVEYYTTTNKND